MTKITKIKWNGNYMFELPHNLFSSYQRYGDWFNADDDILKPTLKHQYEEELWYLNKDLDYIHLFLAEYMRSGEAYALDAIKSCRERIVRSRDRIARLNVKLKQSKLNANV